MPHTPGAHLDARALTSLALVGVVATACSADEPAGRTYEPAVSALCRALDSDDTDTIEVSFLGGAHGPLHELANEVGPVDRGIGADLLIAKNRVERLLRDEATAASLHEAIERLLDQTQAAVRTLDRSPPTC